MAAPVSVLQGARAFARDMPRDNMSRGYLWDINDFVPTLIDTQLTGRGAWLWGSAAASSDFVAGILAPFTAGEQILASTAAGNLYQVAPDSPYGLTSRGTVPAAGQNPVQLFDQTAWFDTYGNVPPSIVTPSANVGAGANAPKARVGAVWKAYVIAGGATGSEDTVWFSPPNDATAAWDVNSFVRTSGKITGLAVLRSMILVFHPGSIERIRGTVPPHTGFTQADLNLESLFGRAGTTEPKTICYWNENVLFADEHGVHMTDGSAIRNLASQGSISYFWRPLYQNKLTISAAVFLDYYVISIVRTDNVNVTLVCDLNKRQWFKFTNLPALSMFGSAGTIGMERVWAGIKGTNRLARVGPCFFPALGVAPIVDDNGTAVLPNFETPWYRLGPEGRKRIRFAYLSYDVRDGSALTRDAEPAGWREPLEGREAPPANGTPRAATPDLLTVSYILSPQDVAFTQAGVYPATTKYERFRVPVGKYPYGIAFKVTQNHPSNVTRVFDIALEAHSSERSRV